MFPSPNIDQQMLLTLHKVVIGEFPAVRINFPEAVDVELADETGEVVVLEVIGEKSEGELGDIGDEEGVALMGPRDDGVGGRVGDHIVALLKERSHTAILP